MAEPKTKPGQAYVVIDEGDLNTLIEAVNEMIGKGWTPLGGVSVVCVGRSVVDDELRWEFCQAMLDKR